MHVGKPSNVGLIVTLMREEHGEPFYTADGEDPALCKPEGFLVYPFFWMMQEAVHRQGQGISGFASQPCVYIV